MSTKNVVLNTRPGNPVNVRRMVQTAMLGGLAGVLMLVEIPLWFAPPFYKIDLSELPVLVGAFAMGPAAGAAIELIKILLNFILNGTMTAGVGELANFLIGCSLVIPAAFIYKRRKTRKSAVAGLAAGTVFMVLIGAFMNAYLLLPAFSVAFHTSIDGVIAIGNKVNPAITGMSSFILYATVPFNLLKGIVVSVITIFIYKPLSRILKQSS